MIEIKTDAGDIIRTAGFLVTEQAWSYPSESSFVVGPCIDNGEVIEFVDADYFELTSREYMAFCKEGINR